jgi:hypothetical protein
MIYFQIKDNNNCEEIVPYKLGRYLKARRPELISKLLLFLYKA